MRLRSPASASSRTRYDRSSARSSLDASSDEAETVSSDPTHAPGNAVWIANSTARPHKSCTKRHLVVLAPAQVLTEPPRARIHHCKPANPNTKASVVTSPTSTSALALCDLLTADKRPDKLLEKSSQQGEGRTHRRFWPWGNAAHRRVFALQAGFELTRKG